MANKIRYVQAMTLILGAIESPRDNTIFDISELTNEKSFVDDIVGAGMKISKTPSMNLISQKRALF